ncbi:unnamed protein product [Rotaria socialis]|uniref:Uncharacterized protein n=1 Tax=Rotaria socialis TaxID=392032 RepID=A0A819WQZ9_9BILA|nr:unnamed protein product [Rotaria socialis]CAF4242920.1 unnamed protein product [Rotaria socialis]
MLLTLIIVIFISSSITADSCESFVHGDYGRTGQCIKISACLNNVYLPKLCESKPMDVMCCFNTTISYKGCPTIIHRARWNAINPKEQTSLATPVPFVAIYDTVSPSCRTHHECVKQIQGIQKYHMKEKNWSDIGYNFLISESGLIYEGRGWNYIGAHRQGYNSRSIGIGMIGNYSLRKINKSAANALESLIQCGDSCESYAHPTYGKTGRCIKTSDCPNSLYISNLCESQPVDIKCCFSPSAPTPNCPNIVSRSEWGARAPKSTTGMAKSLPYVVIHHTTGGTCTAKSACIVKMKGFQNYHMDSNGWDDIGYSFLVGEDGNIYEGRGWTYVGAHTYGYNSQSIGISVIGDYMSQKPNAAAINSVKALIECGISRGYISRAYTLRGHRDLDSTSCPGNAFYNEIKTWTNYRSLVRSNASPQFNVPEDYLVMQDM